MNRSLLILALFCSVGTGCHDTVYGPGYSEAGFVAIAAGDSVYRVDKLVGSPISRSPHGRSEIWLFEGGIEVLLYHRRDDSVSLYRINDEVQEPFESGDKPLASISNMEFEKRFGVPIEKSEYPELEVWDFCDSPSSGNQYHRWLYIDTKKGVVVHKSGFFRWD